MDVHRSLGFLSGFWSAGRPHTGLYAFLLAFVSFKFFSWTDWETGLSIAFAFCLITMSIMRFNDLIDAQNDRRKHKTFAHEHYRALSLGWCLEGILICSVLVYVWLSSHQSALFCALVWVVGLLYSFTPRWYRVQNVIVAICSGSPALSAASYFGTFERHSLFTFFMFTALIWVSEVHKDVEDVKTDVDYKVTLPTELGSSKSILLLIASLHIVAALFFWHPVMWLQLLAVTLVPYLAYAQGLSLIDHSQIKKAFTAMNALIAGIGLTLFVY